MINDTFNSDASDEPFASCTRCDLLLTELRTGYQIVKCWQNSEVVYEYALCQECHIQLLDEFSAESRTRLAAFHATRLQAGFGPTRCATCVTDAYDIDYGEYSITGLFLGNSLQQEVLVCGPCNREMQNLLSVETRKVWDRFLEENFPAPPSDAQVPEPISSEITGM